ncbi:MAG: RnfABCDGE type electron transport complex subunit A [Candidatus Omnitrophica bacterium]|nr:RnfABCDGE type electron transport complex subunit A [Candidatus Omnitrophota bacterium]
MNATTFISIFISAVFINNVILSRFLGLCPFIAISKETKPAIAMSFAVTFVIFMSSIISWCIYRFLLIPFNLIYLRTITFILVIATFVQLVEMIIRKFSPSLYKFFGIYLPLITTNCAVLGVSLLNTDMFFNNGKAIVGSFYYSIFQSFCVGLGYTIAMVLMSAIRERLELCNIPKSFKNFPIAFVIAAIMSMSFLGFNGFKF